MNTKFLICFLLALKNAELLPLLKYFFDKIPLIKSKAPLIARIMNVLLNFAIRNPTFSIITQTCFFMTKGNAKLHINDKAFIYMRYSRLFPKCEDPADVVLDATPNNAAFPNRIEKFYTESQKEQLVFVKLVCDPVKRYESAW